MANAMSETSTSAVSPLDEAKKNELLLGLFLPLQEGAWSPSSAPRETS